VKGAQATAAVIFLARHGESRATIKRTVERTFGYDLGTRLDDLRPTYRFDETCQRTVPPAIIAFLESTDYEDAIRKAISLGGDADTLACIAGSMAEAHYGGVPAHIAGPAMAALDERLRRVVTAFAEGYVSMRREAR
jgi:ADP-ribosylglycohydrolase